MEYIFKGKGISITTPMQDATIATFSSLEKFLDEQETVSVTVEKEKHNMKVTVLFNYANETVKISDKGEDFYSTLDTLADIVKNKMERLHNRTVTKKHKVSHDLLDKEEKVIVKRKFIVPGQMTEEDAMEKCVELGHESFIFQNADMDGVTCLLYRRKDKKFGILEL